MGSIRARWAASPPSHRIVLILVLCLCGANVVLSLFTIAHADDPDRAELMRTEFVSVLSGLQTVALAWYFVLSSRSRRQSTEPPA